MSDQPPIDPTGRGQDPSPDQVPPPQEQPRAPASYGPPGANRQDELMWATLCHVAAFAGFVIPPLGSVLGPLTVWLIKRDVYPLVDDQGKEALNFNISVLIYALVGVILIFAFLIGIPLLIALGIFWLVVTIMAAMAANRGERYRYPFSIRIVT